MLYPFRLLLLFAASFVLLTAPGCDSAPGREKKTVVRMWAFPMLPELRDFTVYEELRKSFEQEHPEIEVQVELLPWAGRMQKMLTAIAGDRAPDAVYLNLDLLARFVAFDALHPINEYMTAEERDEYTTETLDAVTINGKLWLFPILRTVASGLYNRQLLREAGWDPDNPPMTWEEIATVAKTLTKDTNGDGQVDQWGLGFVLGGDTLNMTFWPLLWQAGGEVLSPDGRRAAFNSPQGIEALEFITDLYKSGYMPPSFMGLGGNEFASGRLAYYWGPFDVNQYRRDAPNLDFAIAPVQKNKRRISYSSIGSFGIFKSSKHPRETAEWLRFLTRADNMKKYCLATGFLPAKKSVGPIYTHDPLLSQLEEEAQYCRPDVKSIVARQIMMVVAPEIQAVALGKKTAKQALDEAAEAANAIIAREVP